MWCEYPVETAINPQDTRRCLRYVMHYKALGILVATDGKVMAIVPCDAAEDDLDGLIPPAALECARASYDEIAVVPDDERQRLLRKEKRQVSAVIAPADDGVRSIRVFEVDDAKVSPAFPRWEHITGAIDAPTRPPDLVLDAAHLLRLAKALMPYDSRALPQVRLWFADDEAKNKKPILATVDGEAFGVLMPCDPGLVGPSHPEGWIKDRRFFKGGKVKKPKKKAAPRKKKPAKRTKRAAKKKAAKKKAKRS